VTEPTTGTDTTQLKTRAVREGDHYVVHGQKVWTSRALHSDLMLLLARTTPADQVKKKTEGLSVFLVDIRDSLGHGLEIKPLKGQIDDLLHEARMTIERGERVLVTTLTKRTAEELTDYLRDLGVNVRYLHSEIDAIERVEILRALRKGECDVLVGINLLREGLDLPEVSLVAILDADKEGYLRSTTSLIQTAGRAARHLNGRVILYADNRTQSIQKFLAVADYRRQKQMAYNKANNITPRSVKRSIEDGLSSTGAGCSAVAAVLNDSVEHIDLTATIRELEGEMIEASNNLEFEKAALLRDQIRELRSRLSGSETKSPGAGERARSDDAKARRKGRGRSR
jgi:excinuclease ABC subunit B